MKIAIVGGGNGCLELMGLIDRYQFKEIDPQIIAVADINDDAPGIVRAREKGILVTNNYNDFFNNPDIELIVELTNSMDIYNDILTKKGKDVRALAHTTARLFWEIAHVASLHEETNQELQMAKA